MQKTKEDKYIKNLIAKGENLYQDFKYTINDSKKIAKSLSAFANTKGGRLLIGVKDNGTIKGIKTEEDFYMIEAAAEIYCKPEVNFKSKEWNISGNKVLEITIPESKNKPHLAVSDNRDIAYIRVADENIIANAVQFKVWQKANRKQGIKIKYSETETILLNYLEKNKNISLKKFMKIAMITRKQAIETLSDLIVLELIDFVYIDSKIFYKLT